MDLESLTSLPSTFTEPLADSAPVAHELAAKLCMIETASGESCAWYHGFWQYLRLLGLSKTSGGHSSFLLSALHEFACAGDGSRVLVCGTADYSMPAHAIAAYRAAGQPLDLFVIDRCPTPVALSQWYARRVGTTLTGVDSDILQFVPDRPFDLIFTNSFLGYFAPHQRALLFARWAALLRLGGRLVFTNRVRPGHGDAPWGFTPAEAERLVTAVRDAAATRSDELGVDPNELAERARRYAARFRTYQVDSADVVKRLLDQAGFAIERVDSLVPPSWSIVHGVSGPTTADNGHYVRVIATRAC
jgi:SAM-dependent methyltransferase